MKSLIPFRFVTAAAAAAALLVAASAKAQTWQTVLDYSPGFGQALAANELGNVFTGGDWSDVSGVDHAQVLATDASQLGNTDPSTVSWAVIDDYYPSPMQASLTRVGFDSNNNVYSVGFQSQPYSTTTCPPPWWYVRKSSDFGASWSTVDLFQYVPGQNAGALAIAGDLSGNVFVSGQAYDSNGTSHWLVRKSLSGNSGSWTLVDDVIHGTARDVTYLPGIGLFAAGVSSASKTLGVAWMVRRSLDAGATWSTVDLYQLPKLSGTFQTSEAQAICVDGHGSIYGAGGMTTHAGGQQWLVRRSTDGGATWANVDAFSYVAGQESSAWGIGTDSAGNVVAVGRGHDARGTMHWIVRRPNVQGVWQTVDDYQLASGEQAWAWGVGTDTAGTLLVTGSANDATGASHWIVRRF